MGRFVLFFLFFIISNFGVCGVPIETPEFDERNEFVIRSPEGWGYRTFNGKNGLIGALWPSGTSFNSTDTAVFVFLQNDEEPLPKIPNNINLFIEKCPRAKFKFSDPQKDEDETLSIAEKYFSGRCGRTMILFKEVVKTYTVIISLVSARYVSKKQLADVKNVALAYRKEIEKYVKTLSSDDENNNNENNSKDKVASH